MKIPPVSNHYALLALFLSPCKSAETIGALSACIAHEIRDWTTLLYTANSQICAPLWFVRMNQEGLLPRLPSDLQKYLHHLHQANTERNQAFQTAIQEIYTQLNKLQITAILLKGGAAFCDHLYGDAGARIVGDLDLLVQPQHADRLQKLLMDLGYDAQPDCFTGFQGYFNNYTGHHLPRLVKPGTPVVVEIHFEMGMGQAARVLSSEFAWKNTQTLSFDGLSLPVLTPTCRLLHNTLHALVQDKAVIDSQLPLRELAEFVHLAWHYPSDIDWREWLQRGARHGLGRDFRTYMTLAHRLMGIPQPAAVRPVRFAAAHLARVSHAGNRETRQWARDQGRPEPGGGRFSELVVRYLNLLYSFYKEPVWAWHNYLHLEGLQNLPRRIYYFGVFLAKSSKMSHFLGAKAWKRRWQKTVCRLKNQNAP